MTDHPTTRLFILSENFDVKSCRVEVIDWAVNTDALLMGEEQPASIIGLKVASNGPCRSVVFGTSAGLVLISATLQKGLSEAKITGWQSYSAQVRGKGGLVLNDYRGLAVTGRAGPVDSSSQTEVDVELVSNMPAMRHLRGLMPTAHTWDGSDIFLLDNSYAVCVTERARAVFAAHATNVEFIPAVEYLTPILDE